MSPRNRFFLPVAPRRCRGSGALATRSRRVAFCAIGAALLALGCGDAEPPAPAQDAASAVVGKAPARRNLLLITLDTTRADALGIYGQSRETTPNLDRLARGGVVFLDVSTSHVETLPSHSTIFTGKLPYAHGVRSNSGYLLSERNLTLAEILGGQGYRTGAEVAAPVLRSETQLTQGFDHVRGADDPDVTLKVVQYRDEAGERRDRTRTMRVGADIARRGIEFLRADDGRPFFLWLHFFDAHDPYSAPPAFNKKIPDSRYHAEVASADFQIGLVLLELDRLGLRDSTVVVVTADHGEGLFEHGEPSHSYFLYDSVVRVPLIMAGDPELAPGERIAAPVRTVDIMPTIVDLFGLPPLSGVQGVSLMPLVRGERSDLDLTGYGEATRFTATFGLPPLRFVRRGPWKYIHKVNPELYNVVDDPGESRNLAAAHPELVGELEAALETMLASAGPPPDDAQAALDAETAAQLMALGYVARSPTIDVSDEADALALSGDDPASKTDDIQVVSRTMGLLGRRDFALALTELEPLLERNPHSPFVMDLVAQALVGLERYDDAIVLLRRLVALDPGDREAAFALARALGFAGERDEAIALIRALLDESPCDERFRLEQSGLLRSAGRQQDLLALLADAVERCPDQLKNWNNYAWSLATLPDDGLRDGARALQVIREAIARLPEPDPAFTDTLAAAYAESGDFEAAVRAGREVLEQVRDAGGSPAVVAQLERHLASYRAGRPVRDPVGELP